jgi:hypothetical protein
MDAHESEEQRARLTSLVEVYREHYLRILDAGEHVTAGERADGRRAYQTALERLSKFLADTRYPPFR